MGLKPTYDPQVTPIPGEPTRFTQTFHADQLVLEDEGEVYLVGFADGATHGLIVTFPKDPAHGHDFSVELNDQGNSAEAGEIGAFRLTRESLTIALLPDAKLVASRLSYVEQADDFAGPDVFPEYPLGAIRVLFTAPEEQWHELRRELRRAVAFGCEVLVEEA